MVQSISSARTIIVAIASNTTTEFLPQPKIQKNHERKYDRLKVGYRVFGV
jgi:hypothetical protein